MTGKDVRQMKYFWCTTPVLSADTKKRKQRKNIIIEWIKVSTQRECEECGKKCFFNKFKFKFFGILLLGTLNILLFV